MGELIIGIIWIIISLYCLVTEIIEKGEISTIIVSGIFLCIGIYLTITDLIKIKKDKKTEKKGEECYGIIKNIKKTSDKADTYKIEIITYIESTRQKETMEEDIGTSTQKYDIGNYVKLKYYKGDINIIKKVEFKEMTPIAQTNLKDEEQNLEKIDDIIEINGIKYKRM